MEGEEKNLYELGYLLVPVLSEEAVGEEVSVIKSLMEKDGGSIISLGQPKMTKLAYEIAERGISGRKTKYGDAFFGWIRFSAAPSLVMSLKEMLDLDFKVIRFLLVKPVKDVLSVATTSPVAKNVLKDSFDKRPTMTEKEIDAEIDQLLVGDQGVVSA